MYSLADDEKSIIRTRKHEFVKAVTLAQLDINPNSRVDAGKLFAELLSYKHKDNIKVLSMVDVTQGYCFLIIYYHYMNLYHSNFFFFSIELIQS